jgi:hypothetical protein
MSIGLILGLGIVVNILCWIILMRMYDTLLSFALGYLCIIPYLVAMIFTIGIMTDIWCYLCAMWVKFKQYIKNK